MSQLENLKEIADRNLGGLKADTRMLHEIQNGTAAPRVRRFRWQSALVAGAAAVVLLVAGVLGLPQLLQQDSDLGVVSHSAGGNAPQTVTLTANVPAGSVNITESSGDVPGYHNLFASGQSANFPLIKVGEKTYRMLTSAVTASSSQLGENLGIVTDFTSEPAVSSGGIVSNTAEAGQTVYAVQGMSSAMVAAEVQGKLRVFQRVGFAGTAITGGESLKDVTTGSAGVVSIELSGMGRISDAGQVSTLMDTLFRYAQFQGASDSRSASESLLLQLSNGLTVQLHAGNGTVSACGSWSCPEFFEAFEDAVSQ